MVEYTYAQVYGQLLAIIEAGSVSTTLEDLNHAVGRYRQEELDRKVRTAAADGPELIDVALSFLYDLV
jgi:hypothetical protein